jgi:predicted alpha-1,6-mannanase (GH76 family)
MIFLLLQPHARIAASPSAPSAATEKPQSYRVAAQDAVTALQQWYNPERGTWRTTGWWNSANALEALIDYMALTKDRRHLDVISTTFEKRQSGNFLNEYYDDEGWWGIAWVKAYDLTKDSRYLDMAKRIFDDMKGGWDDTFGGGVWWRKDRRYKNAIPNELFLTLATRLHQRTRHDKGPESYLDWAQKEADWFEASGMINDRNLVNDGLNRQGKNNGRTTWTYNQGVILGGLTEMYRITHKSSYLRRAESIADAAIRTLVDEDGILVEPCEGSSDCGGDAPQFKGIFMRYLGQLYTVSKKASYRDFIRRNADSIWLKDRNDMNQLGLRWAGPFDRADASRQSSALDALNAALRCGLKNQKMPLHPNAKQKDASGKPDAPKNAFAVGPPSHHIGKMSLPRPSSV